MKKFYSITLLTFLFAFSSIIIFAQEQAVQIPDSFIEHLSIDDVDHIQLIPPSAESIKYEDREDEKNGQMMKIARLLPVNLTVENSGSWTKLENGTSIWRLRLSSEGAKSCALHFDSFALPEGSKVFVYNTEHSVVLGPFTSQDNLKREEYAIGLIYGENVIIEYSAPMVKSEDGTISNELPDIQIGEYSYVYRGEGLFDSRAKDTGFGTSQWCQVNVNCSEGDNWRDEQKGVARIYCVEGMSAGYCTGTLINNTSGDQTAYFLTADHCGTDATTSDFNQWIFRFNYESSGCTETSEPTGNNVTGCTRKSRALLNGGSDFILMELSATSTTLKNLGAVYNGWSKSTSASSSGVSIHHPNGDIKKISTYTSSLSTTTYDGGTGNNGASGAHWLVYWSETDNGHGVTEPGSSGSPIFNNNGYVVGTLSGGLSFCTALDDPDLYGKFSYHWETNGSDPSEQLKYWLDPLTTDAPTCEMLDPNSIGLVANFSGNPTSVTVGGQVAFTSLSSGGSITSYSWSFPGGTPSTSYSQNPTITYNTPGTYNVSLTVNTSTDNDTETKTGYITVSDSQDFSYDFESCSNFDVDNFSPCTTYDGDGSTTYGVDGVDFTNEGYTGAFMAFNSTATTPESSEIWDSHGGVKDGACLAATTAPNNDWFITPQINLQNNSSFNFWAKSVTAEYGLERFKVLVSTTNNSIGSFSAISSGSYIEAPISWTKYEYNLSSYDGQAIYIAIQCVSNDAWAFKIDDLFAESSAAVDNVIASKIHLFPNPTDGVFTVSLPETNANIIVRNLLGQEVTSIITNSEETKIDLSNQHSGVYFIEIQLKEGKFTKKITIE